MRIMVVHSSDSFLRAMEKCLSRDFEVLCCWDGLQALEALSRFQPQALILHTTLPRLNGLDMLRQSGYRPDLLLVTTYYLDKKIMGQLQELDTAEVFTMPNIPHVVESLYRHLRCRTLLPKDPEPILFLLGFQPNRTGYNQLCHALALLGQDPKASLSRRIYPAISGDGKAVEKTIRTAIKRAYQIGDPVAWKQYFPGIHSCPSNKAFLLTMLHHLNKKDA